MRALARCAAGRKEIAFLGTQESPDEAAEFAGDGDFGFVALETPGQEAIKAQVQPVLSFPTELSHFGRLAFLASGQFFADLRRQEIMLGAFG